ncbi:hypothetical protein A3J43_01360 [Candidatus Uhrbacteria bacterium RIFCSPHIGHO2_12_FULL_54_23]|uniref:N-acetyltransferase domain-containing protein n=3 Tax=Candidatus Uhriibacteriota TaxID=1752732 RepID=A0A1F7UMQ1_9BACT|nr:MAG: hypothetical protein A3J43_01360 [Candidatus Uhrbacteria bacterium RIFCSPHIGHO2_12_FULL_54_23]OGL84844.1 MAG: hypothetical protein A3B36_00385 [Candidatus Uhrbacteria bacterium RIFCSPLOWO2_01_FULL_55_36]OGL90869.1 MAG: hypothetical protein A3J36_01955 [Candidatus Uhrbacteria bacterium RIFCSPLOWO2_02_FULL_54_37]
MVEHETQGCASCGFPSYAGHVTSCQIANRNESAEEAASEDDRKKFFALFYKVYGITDDLSRRIQLDLKYFDRLPRSIFGEGVRGGERRIFQIHDQEQNVIAGAELVMGENGDRKEAYFGHKIVDEGHRGRDLGHVLVDKRLQIATESGCVEAWSLVEQDNIAALRSITKDGFLIRGNGITKNGGEASRDTYYVSRNLTQEPATPLPFADIKSIRHAETTDQLMGEKILIALGNKALTQEAFNNGYFGRQVVLPKDSETITQPMILMEKTVNVARNTPEE